MAKYTIELKTMMEDANVRPLLDKALSTYPMYHPTSNDEEVLAIIPTREQLNEKLLNHYKYREIGFETIGRFLDELEITMNEIMPYYNQMYNSCEIMALIDDPFGNVDVTETFKQERKGTASASGTSTANATANSTDTSNTSASDSRTTDTQETLLSKELASETPQGNIAITANNIDNVSHADNAKWIKNETNNNNETSGSSSSESSSTNESESESSATNASESESEETLEHTFTKKGNQGVNTYAHDMIEFRESIIDVTMKILEDVRIKNLFMQVF